MGLLITVILWSVGNIFGWIGFITLQQAASIATFISASIVAVMNAPKALKVVKEFFKKRKQ